MVVDAQTPRKAYVYSGAGINYATTFTFLAAADLAVKHTNSNGVDTLLTLGTHYTVAGGSGGTGSVIVVDETLESGASTRLTIYSDLSVEQQTDLEINGGFNPTVLEAQFDRNVRVMQQMQEELDRTVKVTVTSNVNPDEIVQAMADAVAAAQLARNNAQTSAAKAATSETDAAASATASANAATAAQQARDAIPAAGDILSQDDIGTHVLAPDGDGSQLQGVVKSDILTTRGDILTVDGNGALTRLARGGEKQMVSWNSDGDAVAADVPVAGHDMYFGNQQTYTEPGTHTFTVPAETIIVSMQSPGCGGTGQYWNSSASEWTIGTGGSAGVYMLVKITGLTVGESIPVTMGAPGAGANHPRKLATPSSFGTYATLTYNTWSVAASDVEILAREVALPGGSALAGGHSYKGLGGQTHGADGLGFGSGGAGHGTRDAIGGSGAPGKIDIFWE